MLGFDPIFSLMSLKPIIPKIRTIVSIKVVRYDYLIEK